VLDAIVGGERVALDAERALHWPRQRTVFVADVHLGKAAAFRAGGVPVPRGATAADLARLTRIIERSSATRLIVLGDFLHAKTGRVAALADAFIAWRSRHSSIDIVLVRGNHDARAGDPPPDWNVRCVDEPYALPPFLACHRRSRHPADMRCADICTPASASTAAAADGASAVLRHRQPARHSPGVRTLHGLASCARFARDDRRRRRRRVFTLLKSRPMTVS
jgi:DNA ligase-associated metallophosphoesterase